MKRLERRMKADSALEVVARTGLVGDRNLLEITRADRFGFEM